MLVRCTATSLIVRALPGGVDLSQRLKEGQVAVAVGQSFDGEWYYVTADNVAGWAARRYLQQIEGGEPRDLEPSSVKWIGCSPSNYRKGRQGILPIDMIVIHVIEGSLAAADSWFNNPKSEVSAHYGIGLNHELHQYVKEEDTAFHAGRVNGATAPLVRMRHSNPNDYSIGIEHEGTATSAWPDTIYEDSARLVAEIAKRHRIPLDRAHIVGHREIYALKSCPGQGDIDRIVQMARALNL